MSTQDYNSEKKLILHITPHLGGGVGRVLLGYLSYVKYHPNFFHKVACLDYANENAIGIAKEIKLSLIDNMSLDKKKLLDLISEADIVLIHMWNHPLLYDFLVREQLPSNRLIIWCHNNGFHAPFVFTEKLLRYPDIFVFTTPASFETKEVQNLNEIEKKSLKAIISTGGVQHISVKKKEHEGFNIGYIGTVDYAKMHPDFLKICNKIKIPNVKFILCGGPKEEELKKETERLGIEGKFDFKGHVSDIEEYLSIFDAFGYPLAEYHYGTGEQVLQESMAAGVVPVVISNHIERYIVKDRKTGIVAKDTDEYIKALEELYHNPELRDNLSRNAKKYAIKEFSIDKMSKEWEEIFNQVLQIPKSAKIWEISIKKSEIAPKDILLEALGSHGENFLLYCNAKTDEEKIIAQENIKKMGETANWQAKTRSTVHHYKFFFPDDPYISIWSELMIKDE